MPHLHQLHRDRLLTRHSPIPPPRPAVAGSAMINPFSTCPPGIGMTVKAMPSQTTAGPAITGTVTILNTNTDFL